MKSFLIGIPLLFFLTNLTSGQQPNAATNSKNDQSAAHNYFTDTILINQNGENMRFYTDLLQGKTVIIDTFFSTCKTACLPMTQNLKRIQEALGERLGKDVYILSVTVDSEMDTPAQLKAFADKFHARPGWYFLTGTKENVDFVLKKLGQYVDNKQDHLTLFIIGNERTGLWKKAYGLATSDELIKVVDSVLNDKPAQD
ncbi:MAG TPA: SCO family protein [Pyrinomonadaceae bacterium]|nr:SCO family protein [Pyrinomonadaceae bacterium]